MTHPRSESDDRLLQSSVCPLHGEFSYIAEIERGEVVLFNFRHSLTFRYKLVFRITLATEHPLIAAFR